MALVLLSQLFGGLMNVTTRLLETSGSDMHPFQVCLLTNTSVVIGMRQPD